MDDGEHCSPLLAYLRQITQRIDIYIVNDYFKMQMYAACDTRPAHAGYLLALPDSLVFADQ